MIGTDFKLIPLAMLQRHEADVLHRLDSSTTSYSKELYEPQYRHSLLYYLLFTHWPELLNGGMAEPTPVLYNRLYWFFRVSKAYQARHGYDAGFEQQAFQIIETAD